MSEEIPPPQPPYSAPYTNTPFTDVPNAGPAVYPPPPVGGYPPPPGGYQAAPGYAPGYAPVAGATGLSANSAGALAYVTIIPAIIFLILEPYNKMPFVRFHSIQSLALSVAWVVVWIGVTILHTALHFIPLSWLLFAFVDLAISVGFLIAWLMVLIKASQGHWYKLPVIGDFAEKQARG